MSARSSLVMLGVSLSLSNAARRALSTSVSDLRRKERALVYERLVTFSSFSEPASILHGVDCVTPASLCGFPLKP